MMLPLSLRSPPLAPALPSACDGATRATSLGCFRPFAADTCRGRCANSSVSSSRHMQPCEGNDPSNGLLRHSLEDIVCNLLGRVVVGVFENGPDWQARVLHQPGTGYLASNPFNVLALRPVDLFHVSLVGKEIGSLVDGI